MTFPVRRLRPLALFACLLTALAIAPGAGSSAAKRSWAQPEIRLVVARGLMAPSVATFRPNDALTQGELAELVAGLTEQPAKPVANPAAPGDDGAARREARAHARARR